MNFIIILAIGISLVGLNPVFAESESQTMPTDQGTLEVKLSYDEIITGQLTTLNTDFINPQTQRIQEHIDWKFSVSKNGKIIWGPTPLSHTSEGSLKNLKFEFQEDGMYTLEISVEGILFQPIPLEIVSFEIIVGDALEFGELGSEHSHAKLLVEIYGDLFDFSVPVYQLKSSWIHFEENNGITIHKHATGVTLGYLFDILEIGLDDQCYIFQDGRSFCTNDDYSLKFFINGEQINSIIDYEIVDGDEIVISFGDEVSDNFESQLLLLELRAAAKVIKQSFVQEWEWYENETYNYFFEKPADWLILENYQTLDGTILHTVIYPNGFDPSSDIDTPLIGIVFENIPKTDVSPLNAKNLEDYYLEKLQKKNPDGEITFYETVTNSWGWEIYTDTEFIQNNSVGDHQDMESFDNFYVFKNGESYHVSYDSTKENLNLYRIFFNRVLDTMMINGEAVPEFQEIAVIILASSIIMIVLFTRKVNSSFLIFPQKYS